MTFSWRKLVRNWAIQGLNWYALTEVSVRAFYEGGFVLALWLAGLPLHVILVGWLVLHTLSWFFLYGGHMLLWKGLRVSTGTDRLHRYIGRLGYALGDRPYLHTAFLRGSAARGELTEHSDVDILIAPERPLLSKLRGMMLVWRLRIGAASRLIPLEARWLDSPRYIPFHSQGQPTRYLCRRIEEPEEARKRLAARGLLVSLSGLDGSGKTTVAKRITSTLEASGFRAVRFWAHRQAWLRTRAGPDVGLSVMYESLWKRLGRRMEDFEDHAWAKFAYDVVTLIDSVYVQWRLFRLLTRNTIVLCDRYVADVLCYLRSWGPMRETVEGLLIALSREPDLALLFDLPPRVALERKQENSLAQLERFASEYARLATLLGLEPVDASRSQDDVQDEVWRKMSDRLGLGLVRRATRAPNGAIRSAVPADPLEGT